MTIRKIKRNLGPAIRTLIYIASMLILLDAAQGGWAKPDGDGYVPGTSAAARNAEDEAQCRMAIWTETWTPVFYSRASYAPTDFTRIEPVFEFEHAETSATVAAYRFDPEGGCRYHPRIVGDRLERFASFEWRLSAKLLARMMGITERELIDEGFDPFELTIRVNGRSGQTFRYFDPRRRLRCCTSLPNVMAITVPQQGWIVLDETQLDIPFRKDPGGEEFRVAYFIHQPSTGRSAQGVTVMRRGELSRVVGHLRGRDSDVDFMDWTSWLVQ